MWKRWRLLSEGRYRNKISKDKSKNRLPAQVKIFVLSKKDWNIKNTTLVFMLHLMFCKSFAAFWFFPSYHTVRILITGTEYAGLLAQHKGYINSLPKR